MPISIEAAGTAGLCQDRRARGHLAGFSLKAIADRVELSGANT
jgi:hypothetical protein